MSKEQIRNTRTEYRRGVAAAADFLEAGGWDAWVAGTPYRLSDIVRFKFNLMPRKGLRRLHGARRVFVTLPGIERGGPGLQRGEGGK